MARFGQGFIQSLTQPSYQQGLFNLGQQLGSAPTRRMEQQEQSKAMTMVNEALASQDPQKLLAAAQAIQQIDPQTAAKLSQAAGQIRVKSEDSRLGRGLQGGLTAITEAARRGIPLENLAEAKKSVVGLGGTNEQINAAYQAGLTKEEGSRAKGNKTEKEIIENGKKVSYIITTDPYTGEEVGRVKAGDVGDDKDETERFGGRSDWKAPDKQAFLESRDEARNANLNSVKYSDLLNETLSIVDDGGQVGGIFGTARDFVINDVAGLGDAISIHRSRLNEVRMKNAIELLPRGPASDRDVALALDASVDPKNLNPEDRISYIRGMKKLADAEAEYTQGKIRYIEDTGDALAFGYDRYVQLKGAENQLETFKTDNAPVVAAVEEDLNRVRFLISEGKEEEAKALLQLIKEADTTGYLEKLENLERLNNSWQVFSEENNISL